MEQIHGISFIDYAATCAFLAQGKDISELLPTLGVEMPQWDEANAYWQHAMSTDADYKLVSIFGDIFQNPAQGKYAGTVTQSSEDVLKKIPTLERYIEIQEMMSVASSYGIDAQAFLQDQGLTVMDYSQSGMHWMKVQNEYFRSDDNEFLQWFSAAHNYYRQQYEDLFAQQQGGKLGTDIEF